MLAARSVLVVVAHPDDEVLGCGGYLARLAANAEAHEANMRAAGVDDPSQWTARPRVTVLILADGETSRDRDPKVEARRRMTLSAMTALGGGTVDFAPFADQRLDAVALLDLTRHVERLVALVEPDLVISHHAGDLNLDHALVARATLTACRPTTACPVRALMACEVPSATEWGFGTMHPFQPDTFVPIDVDRKLAAMACYASEMRPHPHPRSAEAIRALAVSRGAQGGMPEAEAFCTIWRRAT